MPEACGLPHFFCPARTTAGQLIAGFGSGNELLFDCWEENALQIYADHAATTKPGKTAVRAMLSCMEQNYGNPSSLHQVGQRAAEALVKARQEVADCLGCTAREIYFTSGGRQPGTSLGGMVRGAKREKAYHFHCD